MSWLGSVAAPTPFEAVLGHRPELRARYRAFYTTLFDPSRVPRRVLELCRLRVAAIHDCAAEWRIRDARVPLTDDELADLARAAFSRFDGVERAALEIAERMPYQQHAIDDAHVAAVQAALGPAGAVALLTALAFFDATCRLKLVLGVESPAVALERPPLHDGALA
jgi:alkylhydroperoxidase family enzyme